MFLDEGNRWVRLHCRGRDIFNEATGETEEKQATEHLLFNMESILLNGPQLILEHVFRLIGFEAIDDEVLKHLVTSRISRPSSKSGTVEYLKSYFDEDVELHKIYRYSDKLHKTRREKIREISVMHTRKILGGRIGLVLLEK
jgi:DNA-binding protein